MDREMMILIALAICLLASVYLYREVQTIKKEKERLPTESVVVPKVPTTETVEPTDASH